MSKLIFDTDIEHFEQQVIQASQHGPILVDFWAGWCQPCLVIAPILQQVIDDADGDIRLAKVEVDEGENMKLAGQYKVRGFPTIVLIHKGQCLGQFSGVRSQTDIELFIDELLNY